MAADAPKLDGEAAATTLPAALSAPSDREPMLAQSQTGAPSTAPNPSDREPMLAQSQTGAPSPEPTLCDREPIHIPGSIQPHGFLLALDTQHAVVLASQSAERYLSRPVASIFGRSIPELFGEVLGARVLRELVAEPVGHSTRLLSRVELGGADGLRPFEVVAYLTDQGTDAHKQPRTVLEFESATETDAGPQNFVSDAGDLNVRLFNFVNAIRGLRNVESICQTATHELQALTGCGRVVLYRFDEAGHGLVLAEVLSEPSFDSYLGLRFPASDVPAQARRMYLSNRVRIIPDVNYEPSPLLAPGSPKVSLEASSDPGLDGALDLSPSILRSVAPVHREYMRNMGTVCSMSVSIVIDGKLWGLVSCHHHEPRFVPLRLRSACDFVMQIAASQIEALTAARRFDRALAAKALQARLLAAMAAQDDYMEGLVGSPDLLRELVGADGVAVVTGLSAALSGTTPPQADVLKLAEWLRKRPAGPGSTSGSDDLFSTHTLPAVYPPAAAFATSGSGLLAISISRLQHAQVLWFRQEVIETVRWAGDPAKSGPTPAQSQTDRPSPEANSSDRGPATAQSQTDGPSSEGDSSDRGPAQSQSQTNTSSPEAISSDRELGKTNLASGIPSPRHSFAEWQQTLRGASEPWGPENITAAEDFRVAVLEIVLGRAEALAELAADLQVANGELEAFSYSVSHDLRAPFRHISGFSEMLREEEGERMGELGKQYLTTIEESARFAGQLVDSLLEFSRFARSPIHLLPIDMEDLVDREWQSVLLDEGAGRPIEFSRSPLPCVMGDPSLIRQVLRNLLSNAVKYSARQPNPRIGIQAKVEGMEYVFSVSDNGVGFDPKYVRKLFGVFQRLHKVEDFEGTGIGLANVRRLINRHGGRTWAEGKLGEGATFFFTLPATFPPEEL